MPLTIRTGSAEEAHAVFQRVPEFHENPVELFPAPADITARMRGGASTILLAAEDGHDAGALVGYDKYKDGSAYAWLAGVDARFRRLGALTLLMQEFERWASSKGFDSVELTTRNTRREMLAFLVAQGFLFMEVEPNVRDPRENHIRLLKPLSKR